MFTDDVTTGVEYGRYRALCSLVATRQNAVMLAFQQGLAGFHRLVVLKQIVSPGELGFERFVAEAKLMGSFNHPNIAQVYDFAGNGGSAYCVMEFVPGAALSEIFAACASTKQPLPIGFVLPVVRDTALALHYAHTFVDPFGEAHQVIHRDVSPKNVMVSFDGAVKLLDFGIAKVHGAARGPNTATGMIVGTPGYLSPEQALGKPLDARTDVFSLGVVLYELLTGTRLFARGSLQQEIEAPLDGAIPPVRLHRPEVSAELDRVVLAALARRREERCPTALAFAEAIDRAAGAEVWGPAQRGKWLRGLFSERRESLQKLLRLHRPGLETTITAEAPMPVRRASPSSAPMARRRVPPWVWGSVAFVVALAIVLAAVGFSR